MTTPPYSRLPAADEPVTKPWPPLPAAAPTASPTAATAPAVAAWSSWRPSHTATVAAAAAAAVGVAVVAAAAVTAPGKGVPREWARASGRGGPPPPLRPSPRPAPQLPAVGSGGQAGADRRRRGGAVPASAVAAAAVTSAAPTAVAVAPTSMEGAGAAAGGGAGVRRPPPSPPPPPRTRYFFPRWVAGSQLNNQLVRLAQLLHATALSRGVLVLPRDDAPSAVTAWLDGAALEAASPAGTLTTDEFLATPEGRSLVAAGAIRPAAATDGGGGGGGLDIGAAGAAGTVAFYPDWLVTRWEDEERPPHNGTCAAATVFEYVGVDSLTLHPAGKAGGDGGEVWGVAGREAPVETTPGAAGAARGGEGGDTAAAAVTLPMGIFMSTPWHYCGRRVGGWAAAWRAIRPHPTLAAAAVAYVAASAAPLVAVHVRDLEDFHLGAVLDAVDGVAAEVHRALLDRAAATGVPPRTVHVSHVGDAPARVRNALAARLAAAGGWQAAVVVAGCAQLPGCALPPAASAAGCVAATCATATPDPAAASRVAAFFASRAPAGGSDGGGVGAGTGMYEMAVWLAADFFIGVRASTMSVNAALMRAAGGPGVGGGGHSRVADMRGFQAFGPYGPGWTQHYWTNTWTTAVAEAAGGGRTENSTWVLPGGGVGVLVPEMTGI